MKDYDSNPNSNEISKLNNKINTKENEEKNKNEPSPKKRKGNKKISGIKKL